MAVSEDVKPAYVSAAVGTVTTASFTPAANTLLVVCGAIDNGLGTAGSPTGVVSDSQSGTWTLLKRASLSGGAAAEVWCRDGSTSVSMTVTYASTGATWLGVAAQAVSYTGAKATASQTGASATATAATIAVTTTVTGSLVVGAFGYADASITLTANGVTTIFGQFQDGTHGATDASWRATSTTGSPGATTFGFTNTTAATMMQAAAEILPSAAAALPIRRLYQAVNRAATY